jgi:hypothetical protein
MGCDYYILELLHIYYNDKDYLEIELNRERGYYNDLQFDEDDDDFEEKLNQYIHDVLTSKKSPIVIYKNAAFNKSSCETKYKALVENKINKHDILWSEITKIIKVEERRER